MPISKSAMAVIAVIIIAVIAIGYTTLGVPSAPTTRPATNASSSIQQQTPGSNPVAVQLTDPPTVPSGTQALVINYDSVAIHISGVAHSGWVQSNSTGSVDLLSLSNLSQTLAVVSLPNGSVADMARFYVTSAHIKISNTTYNVTMPSNQITAQLNGNASVNKSDSILLSMSPTVVEILTSNQTIFVMVPSIRAVVVANGTVTKSMDVGARQSLEHNASAELERITPNITITNASLSVAGNTTRLSVTVKNNANQSVLITHVTLSGDISTSLNSNAIADNAARVETELRDRIGNSTVCAAANASTNGTTSTTHQLNTQARVGNAAGTNVSIGQGGQVNSQINASSKGGNGQTNAQTATNENAGNETGQSSASGNSEGTRFNSSELGDIGEKIHAQVGMELNSSVCTATGLPQFQNEFRNRSMNLAANFGLQQMTFKQIHFLVSSNGTLSLPYLIEDFNDTGYLLQSGQSHTFTYYGSVVTNDGGLSIVPVANSIYSISVGGEHAAGASINVTVR